MTPAILAPSLSRRSVFDARKDGRTYATTESRIYLDVVFNSDKEGGHLKMQAASEEGIREAAVVLNGDDVRTLQPDADKCVIVRDDLTLPLEPGDFCYVRITTNKNNMAWSSPHWA